MNIRTAIEAIPRNLLWFNLDYDHDTDDTFLEGDLVEWTRYDDDTEIGIGIISEFSIQCFYDYSEQKYVDLPCAYVVNANPDDPYGYCIPLTHLDPIGLDDYLSIYEDEYEANFQTMQTMRYTVIAKMQAHGWQSDYSDLSDVLYYANPIQVGA